MSYHEQEAVNLYKCGANDNRVELEIEMISKHERLNNGSVLHYDSTNKVVYDPDSILMHEVFIKLALNSIPSIVAMIVEYSIFSLNVVFIGYLDDPVAMSGCGLGGMTANILAYSLGVGIWGGIDTLVSQAFGRKDYESCKIYLIFFRKY